jgi:hypothetical protein
MYFFVMMLRQRCLFGDDGCIQKVGNANLGIGNLR